MGLQVEILAAQSSSDSGTTQRFIDALKAGAPDVIIYRYDARSFARLANLLSQYASKLVVQYEAPASLNQLRRYALPGYSIQTLEQERQLFAQWVQKHADQAQWMPESVGAQQDLLRWKVRLVPDKLLLTPPFTPLQEGLYAQQDQAIARGEAIHLLAAGQLSPEMGQLDSVAAFYDYLQALPAAQRCASRLTFLQTAEPSPSNYPAEVKELIERLGLADNINFAVNTTNSELEQLMGCSALICCQQTDERYAPITVKARAMGIPVIQLVSRRLGLCEQLVALQRPKATSEPEPIAAALYDLPHRRQLVVGGYKTIVQRHSHDKLRHHLLSQVLAVLVR